MTERKRNATLITGIVTVLTVLFLMADGCSSNSAPPQQQVDTQNNNNAAARLHKAQPYPVMTDSQELANQREWYLRLNDPNKIAYVYLITMDGKVFAEYQIRAKCSSTNSQYSAPDQVVTDNGQYNGGNVVIPAAQPDGSYGVNEQAVFCFLNDAKRTMIEFSEQWHYIWSEQPLNLTTAPTIVVVPNGG